MSTATEEAAPQGKRQARWQYKPGKRLDLLAAALMLVLAFVFMLPGLPPGRVAAPMEQILSYPPWNRPAPVLPLGGGDLIHQQLPWRYWEQQEFAAGRFPLWASAPLGGEPLFASMQPGVLYPLNLLWILVPIGGGLGVVMALKLWLAGLGMWFFLRALGLHPVAALLSSLGFMFSTWLVDWLPWAHTSAYLLLPWLLWIIYLWWRKPRVVLLAAVALLVACAIFAGHPETLFIVLVAAGLWTIGLAATTPLRAWLLKGGGLALAVGLGFAAGAVQLLPFLQALQLSHIEVLRTQMAAGIPRQYIAPELLADWAQPRFWGYFPDGVLAATNSSFYEYNGYVGLVALLGLALAGIAVARRKVAFKVMLPLVAIGVVSFLITYDSSPVSVAIRSLPMFNRSANARWVAMVAFAVLVVGAFGWDWLARSAPIILQRREGWKIAGAALLAAGGAILLLHAAGLVAQPILHESGPWRVVNGSYQLYWAIWAVGLTLTMLGATALWLVGGRVRVAGQLLIVALLLLDLWSLLLPENGSAPADDFFPDTSFVSQERTLVPPTERVLVQGNVLPTDTGLILGVRDWRSQDPMLTERAFQAALFLYPKMDKSVYEWYNMILQKVNLQVAPMLGMRYFILPVDSDPGQQAGPGGPLFTRLAYTNGLGLWRAEGVPGFTYLSDNVQAVSSEQAAAAWMKGLTWEQVRSYQAIVEAQPSSIEGVLRGPQGASPGGTEVKEYWPGHIKINVDARRTALLVVAESFYPGWQATIDGKPAQILRANYLSQGVVVPVGAHTIELNFTPEPFVYGGIISLGGLLGIMLLLAGPWLRRKAMHSSSVNS